MRRLRVASMAGLGLALLGACDSILDPASSETDGMEFSYSGALAGSFAASGTAEPAGGGVPVFDTFAAAEQDSIGGLLLAGFRKTDDSGGDLFILQLRGTDPGTYVCAGVEDGPSCYGHLYLGIRTDGGAAAEQIYGISAGEVGLAQSSGSRVTGTLRLSLRDIHDASRTLAVESGTFDVPLVDGVFGASFACLVVRLEKGPTAPCDQ